MTDEQHNRYIAICFLIHGGFQSLITLLIGLMFFYFLDPPGAPGPPPGFFVAVFGFMFFFQTIITAPSFVAAYALLNRKSWARLASIVAAILSATSAPIGTGAAVYALWFFIGENWKSVYAQDVGEIGEQSLLKRGEESAWETSTADQFTFQDGRTIPPDWR